MGLLTLKSKTNNIKFVSSPSTCLVKVETDVARELNIVNTMAHDNDGGIENENK